MRKVFKIVDDYTFEEYLRLRIKQNVENKEEIEEKFKNKYVIYSKSCGGKFIKRFDIENKKIEFTNKLGNAILYNNLVESRRDIIKIMNTMKDNHSSYFEKISGKELSVTKLKSCSIEIQEIL